jgi:hypothetical protein
VHEINGHSVYAMSFSDIEEAMLQVQGAYLRLAVSQPPTLPLNEILFRFSGICAYIGTQTNNL